MDLIYIYVYVCIHTYIHTYVYMYIHTHTFFFPPRSSDKVYCSWSMRDMVRAQWEFSSWLLKGAGGHYIGQSKGGFDVSWGDPLLSSWLCCLCRLSPCLEGLRWWCCSLLPSQESSTMVTSGLCTHADMGVDNFGGSFEVGKLLILVLESSWTEWRQIWQLKEWSRDQSLFCLTGDICQEPILTTVSKFYETGRKSIRSHIPVHSP